MNICKVQKVRKVNTGRRLKIPVIDIFEKFFLHVAEDALLSQSEEDESDLLKKIDHFAKFTFCSKEDLLPHEFHAHTFGSLTAEPLVLAQIRDHF